jgi:sugar O-acyltransferase (sialic acid O-acetyltransferase NeuD family)
MNKGILLVGGGGHCKSVLDSLLELNEYAGIGIVDQKEHAGRSVLGVPVIGCDDDLERLFHQGYSHAFVTIGNLPIRMSLYDKLMEIGFQIPAIVDASAAVSGHAVIEEGVFVGKRSVVNAGCVVGKGAIINTGAIVEHDCRIGAFAHIAPGAVLSGEVVVGDHTHIGANAAVRQQVRIGSDSMIGMGSVVVQNIGSGVTAYGNPCREAKSR